MLVFTAVVGGAVLPVVAQNIGFYNLPVKPGDNLIAYQLDNSPDNDINHVLLGGVLTGSTFTEWDPVGNQLLPVSTFNGTTWSINYPFAPDGIGGVLNSPDDVTLLFAGSVVNLVTEGPNTGQYDFTPPERDSGTFLLAAAATVNGATFQQIIGRNPNDGDAVRTLDSATQQYSTTTFNNGAWNNGTPSLGVGQAAYFDLAVPEPSVYALTGLGALLVVTSRKMRIGKSRSA